MSKFAPYVKAASSAVFALCAYFVGVMGAGDEIQDLTQLQWIGAVLFVLGSFGITYYVPYRSTKQAGPAEIKPVP